VLLLSALVAGFVSGLVPFLSIEVYLGGLAAATSAARAAPVGLALAAAVGQTAAKVVWYEAAARSTRSAWVQRKLADPRRRQAFDRWQARVGGRPWLTAGVLLAAALVGFPPLMIIAVVAGSLRVPLIVYVPTVLVGRAVRFWLVLAGVGWFAS
jgi:membrane protein YqaA with SNARE-associated domain